jgi:hypothetical protein
MVVKHSSRQNRELTCASKILLQSRESAFGPKTLARSRLSGFWGCENPLHRPAHLLRGNYPAGVLGPFFRT